VSRRCGRGASPAGRSAVENDCGRPRRTFGTGFALVRLAPCAALFVRAVVVSAGDDSGESMAIVFALLATDPANPVPFLLPGPRDGRRRHRPRVAGQRRVTCRRARALRRGGRPEPASRAQAAPGNRSLGGLHARPLPDGGVRQGPLPIGA
jgi:hypothetical protein